MQNTRKTSKREWMCFYCNLVRKPNAQDFVFSEIDELYNHWLSMHSNDIDDEVDDAGVAIGAAAPPKQKPFRFCCVDLLYCNMDACYYFSTFQGLRNHHDKKHANELFVPILNNRCALCLYDGNDLNEHKCGSLRNGMQLQLYNPVLLTTKDLAELQSIKCPQSQKKHIECQRCGSIFGAREQMIQHHHQSHG